MLRKNHTTSEKAAENAAFLWLPVLLALLLSLSGLTLIISPGTAAAPSPGGILERPEAPVVSHPDGQEASSPLPGELSPIFTAQVQQWQPQILRWSKTFSLDPNFIATIMQIESCGNSEVSSPAGAMGLFQVMPYHFANGEDPFDPETNAARGLSYLRRSLEIAGGDVISAMAGYNGGHSVIHAHPGTWTEETRRYVYWGSGILEEVLKDKSESDRLREWLLFGGESLCRRATLVMGLNN
jgi:hypothetical protein